MPGSATYSFTEPEAFRSGLRLLGLRVFVAMQGQFSATLTHAVLPHLHLLSVTETLPRIAFCSLPADALCISFPTAAGSGWPLPVCAGEQLHSGDILFHGRGERLHQWTRGAGRWGLMAMEAGFLARYGRAHYDIDLVSSATGQVSLRPTAGAWKRLFNLHTRAGRVVETRPSTFVHPEAARSLEHDLIHALAECIAQGHWLETSSMQRQRARIMERFEAELATRPHQNASVVDICTGMGVSERTLRMCCRQFLGMAPARYLNLRRLALVRAALLDADQRAASVAEIARLHGFAHAGKIGGSYRAAFGETPSMTLHRAGARWG